MSTAALLQRVPVFALLDGMISARIAPDPTSDRSNHARVQQIRCRIPHPFSRIQNERTENHCPVGKPEIKKL